MANPGAAGMIALVGMYLGVDYLHFGCAPTAVSNHSGRPSEEESIMFHSTRALRRFAVGALSAAALAGAFGLGAVVAQQPTAATKVTPLMKQVIAEYPGHEVTMLTLDIPPGGGSPPHRHPGHHIFGYVLEGAYAIKLDDGPEKTLTKGETFYEAPGRLHAVSRNASETTPAKVLVVILAESGKPVTVPEQP
jgi:quercetin dioxygenase-like cupin family protein